VFAGAQEPADPTARVVDLLTPFGKGQRALLAGAPRTGKTTVLQHLIRSLETNHDDLELLVLVLDERPEDITEMTRWVEKGEVVAAAFDRPAEEQVTIAEMVIERAKRLVESGKDVVVVVDGATRLARAYAQEAASSRSGVVVDSTTVHPAKRVLAAARNLEGGGSLTMIATITVDNDSAADAAIYEELAPTANLELRLSRAAAVRRVFPAIDIAASATVHEERLRDDKALADVRALRGELAAIADEPGADAAAALHTLLDKIAAE
jgi:transcription termination factor Rho